MSPEKQRIAIAEALGLFRLAPLRRTTRKGNESPDGVLLWYCESHHGGAGEYCQLPNWPSDLNACAAMEATLDPHDRNDYIAALWKVTGNEPNSANFWSEYNFRALYACLHATAPQRCEAFLRTKGEWDDT